MGDSRASDRGAVDSSIAFGLLFSYLLGTAFWLFIGVFLSGDPETGNIWPVALGMWVFGSIVYALISYAVLRRTRRAPRTDRA